MKHEITHPNAIPVVYSKTLFIEHNITNINIHHEIQLDEIKTWTELQTYAYKLFMILVQ